MTSLPEYNPDIHIERNVMTHQTIVRYRYRNGEDRHLVINNEHFEEGYQGRNGQNETYNIVRHLIEEDMAMLDQQYAIEQRLIAERQAELERAAIPRFNPVNPDASNMTMPTRLRRQGPIHEELGMSSDEYQRAIETFQDAMRRSPMIDWTYRPDNYPGIGHTEFYPSTPTTNPWDKPTVTGVDYGGYTHNFYVERIRVLEEENAKLKKSIESDAPTESERRVWREAIFINSFGSWVSWLTEVVRVINSIRPTVSVIHGFTKFMEKHSKTGDCTFVLGRDEVNNFVLTALDANYMPIDRHLIQAERFFKFRKDIVFARLVDLDRVIPDIDKEEVEACLDTVAEKITQKTEKLRSEFQKLPKPSKFFGRLA